MHIHRSIVLPATLLSILLFPPPSISTATTGEWTIYTVGNSGLASNWISNVVVDADGVKWIGYHDREGITRFDGVSWKTFTIDEGIPKGKVDDIILSGGVIWAAIGGKICKFNGTRWEVLFSEGEWYSFYRIAFDRTGNLWAAGITYGYSPVLSRYDGSSWTTWLFSWIDGIFADRDNTLWVTSTGDLQRVYHYDGTYWKRLPKDYIPFITSMTEDRNQVMWLITNSGVARYDGTSLEYIKDIHSPSVAIDHHNRKWFVNYNHVLMYEEHTGTIERFDYPSSMEDINVDRIAVDMDGSLFLFGMWDATGLIRFTPNSESHPAKTVSFERHSIPVSTHTAPKPSNDPENWLFPLNSGDTWIYRHTFKGGHTAPVFEDRFILTVIDAAAPGDSLDYEFLDGRSFIKGDVAYYHTHPHERINGRGSFPTPPEDGIGGDNQWEPVSITVPAGTFMAYEITEQFLGGRFWSFVPDVGWARARSFTCLGIEDNLDLEYARIGGREYGMRTAARSQPRPDTFRVYPPAPNPFNPSTAIRIELGAPERVQIAIYTITGQKVATLCDTPLAAGSHVFTWKPEHCAAGLYLYSARADGQVRTGKMLLLK